MAAPQSHGLIGMASFVIFLLLGGLSLVGKISFWDYFSVCIWFFLLPDAVDICLSRSFLKDLFSRIFKRGGGPPAKDVKVPIAWAHTIWIFLLIWTLYVFVLYSVAVFIFHSSFNIWLSFVSSFVLWSIHVAIDHLQKGDVHYSPFYPLHKKTWILKWGYPIKPPAEFILGETIWMLISFMLLGILILK